MKYISSITQFFSPHTLVGYWGNVRVEENDPVKDLFDIVEKYRVKKMQRNALVIETSFHLPERDISTIRETLVVPEEIQTVEVINPSLGSAIRIVHNRRIYLLDRKKKIDAIRTFFVNS